MPKPEYRCSSLPLLMNCPAAAHPAEGEVLVDSVNPAATMGVAVHDVMACEIVPRGSVSPDDLEHYTLKHGVDPDELGVLVWFGTQVWKKIHQYFRGALIEREMCTPFDHHFTLTGHKDVGGVDLDSNTASVCDWKTGRVDRDHYHQMAGYAWLTMLENPLAKRIVTVVVWLRDQTYEVLEWTPEELDRWADEFVDTVVNWDGTYHPGPHCTYCPRLNSCPARHAMVRSAITELMGPDEGPADLAECGVKGVRMAKLITAKCDEFIETVRAHVTTNGPLPDGEGRELWLRPEFKDTIDAEKAWPVITEHLTQDEFAPAIAVRKTALLKAVGNKAERGQKGTAKKAFLASLEKVGAVSTQEIHKLVERRVQKESDDGQES